MAARAPGGAATMAVVARRAAGRAAAADDAVRCPVQPPGSPARQALEASLYPANLASTGRRQRDGLAGEHANLLGTQFRYAAGGAGHRPLVQLPVRRRHNHDRAAVVRHCRRRADAARAAAADGRLLVALLYMLGRYTPFYALAFDYVPGIKLFRRPVDGAFVFVAVLAILAGHLLADYVREGLPRKQQWHRLPLPWERSR